MSTHDELPTGDPYLPPGVTQSEIDGPDLRCNDQFPLDEGSDDDSMPPPTAELEPAKGRKVEYSCEIHRMGNDRDAFRIYRRVEGATKRFLGVYFSEREASRALEAARSMR